jgi:hypothetical protein
VDTHPAAETHLPEVVEVACTEAACMEAARLPAAVEEEAVAPQAAVEQKVAGLQEAAPKTHRSYRRRQRSAD